MQEKKTFVVSGMHCASCSAVITKRLKKLPGVQECEVNYATEKAVITLDNAKSSLSEMNKEVEKLGYKLTDTVPPVMEHTNSTHLGLDQSKADKQEALEKLEQKVQFSLPITLLIFLSMVWEVLAQFVTTIPQIPLPMMLVTPTMLVLASVMLFWIGKPYLDGVSRFFHHRVANMDTLVGIGTLTAYLYSSLTLLLPSLMTLLGVPEHYYFDVTIVVIGFITLGKYLEARSKIKTGEAIEKLLELQAKTATVIRGKKEVQIPIEAVMIGDEIVVKPGEKIPVDGKIIVGETAIDESLVTGEPIPQDKKVGDKVIGSTINKHGRIIFTATKVGADTMLSQIIALVQSAQGSRAPIQNLADKISAVFVPVVLVLAVLTLVAWLTVGAYFIGFSAALTLGLTSFVGILVVACPCALGLATPTAIIVGVGKGAQSGILVKNAESLERLYSVDSVIFDKTGTITNGRPVVTDCVSLNSKRSEDEVIQLAASVERNSAHPLAQAIVNKAVEQQLSLCAVTDFVQTEGIGVSGEVAGEKVTVRRPDTAETEHPTVNTLLQAGKTVVAVVLSKKTVGFIAMSDTVKPGAQAAVQQLRKLGIAVQMITGDNKKAGEYIAQQVGIDEVLAEVLPHQKSEVVERLQKAGKKVAMVGDGINDAPALAKADVGIAMGGGTDVAIEAAGITLLRSDIELVPQSIKLARATMHTIKQNLFWAFAYNIVLIPVAMGVLYPLWGITLSPALAGAAMATSSVTVVLNALRLKQSVLR
jgi:Cu2+-exporting ATPase/Cu+-exporting ATPase